MQPLETIDIADWSAAVAPNMRERAAGALESGKVLYFPHLGFPLQGGEAALLSPALASGERKNITRDPKTGACQGADIEGPEKARLESLLTRFSDTATRFFDALIPAYAARIERARTTFRPIEIAGRSYSPKKDDRLLHVDAFPSRPTGGRRIVRLFTNINPEGKPRVWQVGEPFPDFAAAFLPKLRKPNTLEAWALDTLRITKGRRSAYDQLMLQLHDRGKLDVSYQRAAPQAEIEFPPGSTWICFTDQVLHAALSGQYALEQTFHLDVADMVDPAKSPIRVLERLAGRELA